MQPINESRIAEIVLLFLRERYKYYPLRSGNIVFKTNLRGSGQLKVDGTVSFTRDGAPDFLASIEATDYSKRDELWFRIYWELALWDSTAISTTVLTAIFAWMHLSGHLGPFKGNPLLLSGTGLLLFLVLTWLVFRAIRLHRRYRYIYAVEQFRRYAANEQWIAFSWDVFPSANAPVFLELRDQCVINGLGLVEILRDGKVKMHLSPAREGMPTRRKRLVVPLLTGIEWPRALQTQLQGNAWRRLTGGYLSRLTGKKEIDELLRFERPVTGQIWIILGAVSLTVFFLVKEYGKRPVVYVKEERYEKQMLAFKETLQEYSYDILGPDLFDMPDSAAVFKSKKGVEPYGKLFPDSLPESKEEIRGWMILEGNKIKSIDCATSYLQVKGRFIVMAGTFNDVDYLKATMTRLKSNGLLMHSIWGNCFFERKNYFILVLPETFREAEAAQRAAFRINGFFNQNGFTNLNATYAGVE